MSNYSYIGVDLGSYYYKVGRVKEPNHVVEIVPNKLDKRSSRSAIGFSKGKKCPVGQKIPAKDVKNSLINGKDIFAKAFDGKQFANIQNAYKPFILSSNQNNVPIFTFDYYEDNLKYNSKDIYLNYFYNIYDMIQARDADSNTKDSNKNQNYILSYPINYSKEQRDELKSLCNFKMEELSVSCCDIIDESTAYALCYGYENNTKIEDTEINLLVDIGYINATVTCAKYEKDKCTVLGTSISDEICGRNIDKLMVDSIKEEIFNDKDFKVLKDIFDSKPDYLYKVQNAVITAKEKLSADGASDIKIEVSDLYDSDDFESNYSKDKLNSLLISNNYKEKIFKLLDQCLNNSKVQIEEEKAVEGDNIIHTSIKDISSIVIAGGTCRIPFIQEALKEYLNTKIGRKGELNKTINMDEHIANGICYYSLIKSDIWKYSLVVDSKDVFNSDLMKREVMKQKIRNVYGIVKSEISKIMKKEYLEDIKEIIKEEGNLALEIVNNYDNYDKFYSAVQYDKHLQEADKKRNDLETRLYDYQHEVEKLKNEELKKEIMDWITKQIEKLHTDKTLRMMDKVLEYENDLENERINQKKMARDINVKLCNCATKIHSDDSNYQELLSDLKSMNVESLPINQVANTGSSKLKLSELIKDYKSEISKWEKLLKEMPIINDYDVKNDLKNKKSLEERNNVVNDSISLDDLKSSIDDTYKLFTDILSNTITAMDKIINEIKEDYKDIDVNKDTLLISIEGLKETFNKRNETSAYLASIIEKYNMIITTNDSIISDKKDNMKKKINNKVEFIKTLKHPGNALDVFINQSNGIKKLNEVNSIKTLWEEEKKYESYLSSYISNYSKELEDYKEKTKDEIEKYEIRDDEKYSVIRSINELLIPSDSLENISKCFEDIDNIIKEAHQRLYDYFKELLKLLNCVDDYKDFKIKVDKKVDKIEDIANYNSDTVNGICHSISEKLLAIATQFEDEIKAINGSTVFGIQYGDDVKVVFEKKRDAYVSQRNKYLTIIFSFVSEMNEIKDNDEVDKIKKDINDKYITEYTKLTLIEFPKVIGELKSSVNTIVDKIVEKYKLDIDKYDKLCNNVTTKPFPSFKLNKIKRFIVYYQSLIISKGLRFEKINEIVKKEYDRIMEQIESKIKEIDIKYNITEETDVYDVLYDLLTNPPNNQDNLIDVKDEKDNKPPTSDTQVEGSKRNSSTKPPITPNDMPGSVNNGEKTSPPQHKKVPSIIKKKSSKIEPNETEELNK